MQKRARLEMEKLNKIKTRVVKDIQKTRPQKLHTYYTKIKECQTVKNTTKIDFYATHSYFTSFYSPKPEKAPFLSTRSFLSAAVLA